VHNAVRDVWRESVRGREWQGLEEAVGESGGRIRVLQAVDEIEPAFEEIMVELRGQYVLGYYPTRRRSGGSWRPVKVKVNVPSARVRFRAGYIDN